MLVTLFLLAGLGTACIAVYYVVVTSNQNLSLSIRFVFGLLIGLDALFYFLAAWGLYRKAKWVYNFALALIAINILGLVFDDFGLADMLAGLFNLLLGVLLIARRR